MNPIKRNPEFQEHMKDPDKKEFYEVLKEILKEYNTEDVTRLPGVRKSDANKLGNKAILLGAALGIGAVAMTTSITTLGAIGTYFAVVAIYSFAGENISDIREMAKRGMSVSDILKELKKKVSVQRRTELEGKLNEFDERERYMPNYYDFEIEPHTMSEDVVANILMYIQCQEQSRTFYKIEKLMLLGKDAIKERRTAVKVKKSSSIAEEYGYELQPEFEYEDDNISSSFYQTFLDRNIYNKNFEYVFGNSEFGKTMEEVLLGLYKYTLATLMSGNTIASIKNYVGNSIKRLGYNFSELNSPFSIESLKYLSGNKEKLEGLKRLVMYNYNFNTDTIESLNFTNISMLNTLVEMHDWIQTADAVARASFQKDGISIFDDLQFENGVPKLTKFSKEELVDFILKTRKVYGDNYGAYSEQEKSILQLNVFGKILFALKGYLYRDLDRKFSGKYYDFSSNDVYEGLYRPKLISEWFSGLSKETDLFMKNMEKYESVEFKNKKLRHSLFDITTGLPFYILLGFLISSIDWGDDDEKDGSIMYNVLLTILGSFNENTQIQSLFPTFGFYDISTGKFTVKFGKLLPVYDVTINRLMKLRSDVEWNLFNDEEMKLKEYEEDTKYNEAGDIKLYQDALKMIPIVNKAQLIGNEKLQGQNYRKYFENFNDMDYFEKF